MDIVDHANQYTGRQETNGSNRGQLVDKWKGVVSKSLADKAIPWCACFGFAMLVEITGLTKKALATQLGFEADEWYPESTLSWLQQATAAGCITHDPKRGDFFLLLKPDGRGGFLAGQPHHLGILAQDGCPAVGSSMDTVEGNTVPGHIEGFASREGDGVYARTRTVRRGELVFISIPESLKRRPESKGGSREGAPPRRPADPAPEVSDQAAPPSAPPKE